jgi:hypothetical protein
LPDEAKPMPVLKLAACESAMIGTAQYCAAFYLEFTTN